MRTRSVVFSLALTVLLLAGGAVPSAALSERAANAQAVPGRMIAAPGPGALVTRLPVPVALRVPANTTRLRVRLGRRDVSGRFGASGGSLRVARLSRGDGLRYGHNELSVLVERRGGRPVIHARSFDLARRHGGLVRVRVRPGPVTSLNVRVAGAERLSTIRRSRLVRLWVNGRPATRALDRSQVTRLTARLSAAHGLRYGLNRLRLMVAEPDHGRYVVVRRRFVLKRNRHLAAAGWDVDTRAGRFVQLDGRRSRTAGGREPRHRWRIVRRPSGSRARLRRSRSARPSITPDRPGRYVIGLELGERNGRAAASQGTPSNDDFVELTAAPPSPLLAFKGLTKQNGQNGILVGDTFYPNKSPNGAAMQWLTLQRGTLTLANPSDNNWLDGTGSGDHGIQQLTAALKNQGTDRLVILSYPYAGGPPVQADQMAAFNAAMQIIGVSKISSDILADRNKLAILGIPKAGAGNGWYTHGGGPVDALEGWLMPDQVTGYRFQPDRPAFDTSASHTATTNTMNLAGQQLTASLPAGATGGFQLEFLDPIDFTSVDRQVFPTNGVADPVKAINAMADYLRRQAQSKHHVVVQSIGSVGRPAPPSDPYQPDPGFRAWTGLGQALAAFGANPDTFFGVNRAYAFVGGPWLDRAEVAQSSTGVVTDPTKTPKTTQTGTLSGRLSIRSDGYVVAAAADPNDRLGFELYDMAFKAPTPWPYTREAKEPHYADYTKAMTYITKSLETTKKGWGNDLRVIYTADLTRDWGTERDDLAILPYPADQLPCSQPRGRDRQPNPGFTKTQYCALVSQLRDEMAYLNSVYRVFKAYKDTLNQTGAENQVDLQTIGKQIHDDVSAPNDDLASEIGNFFFMLLEAAGLFISIPEGGFPIELAAIEALAATYELSMSLSLDARTGVPVGDQVDSKVDSLAQDTADRLKETTKTLDGLREVIVSDYGRLHEMGTAANTPQWVIKSDQLQDYLTIGAKGYFTTELMPVGYNAWYLSPTFSWNAEKPDSCFIWGYGHSWKDSDVTNWWRNWQAPFPGQSDRGGSLLALGKKTWKASQYAYPPDTVTKAFDPQSQGGYGVSLADHIWEKYTAPYPSVSCYT